MKKEDVEFLSLNEFEEEQFTRQYKKKELVPTDRIVDTKSEKDMEDEIELEQIKNKKKKVKVNKTKKEEPNKIIKYTQIAFCSLSILFILICCAFYGTRMIKYYKIYNPKDENGEAVSLLGTSITSSASIVTEGEGLYRIAGSHIYKGSNVDNYLKFSNRLWRIIKVNNDGSLDVVTDDFVNELIWNKEITEYKDTDINEYLNDVFLKTLNKDLLTVTGYCTDKVESLSSITCNNTNTENYVRLLGITEFLNSSVDNKSYMSSYDKNIWLYNHNDEKVWYIAGMSISNVVPTSGYPVKAVVHIKNSTTLLSGKGTKDDPYIIEKESKDIKEGSYVKLGKDTWIIYENNNGELKLALDKVLSGMHAFAFTSNKYDASVNSSLASYLNTTYLNSLSYKGLLEDTKWYIGSYTSSYKDVYGEEMTAKVGILNMADLKYNINPSEAYYISTSGPESYAYIVSANMRLSKISISRNVKPTVSIKSNKIKGGKGTKEDPYVVTEG